MLNLLQANLLKFGEVATLCENFCMLTIFLIRFYLILNISAEEIYNKGISHINVGSGQEITINNLALMIKRIVGFAGEIVFDKSMPDGMPRKLLDTRILNEKGWHSKINLKKEFRKYITIIKKILIKTKNQKIFYFHEKIKFWS